MKKLMLGFLCIFLIQIKSYGFLKVIPDNVPQLFNMKSYYDVFDVTIKNTNSNIKIISDKILDPYDNTLIDTDITEYIFELNKDLSSDKSQVFETITWVGSAATLLNWKSTIPGGQVIYMSHPQDRMIEFRIELPAGSIKGGTVTLFIQNTAEIGDIVSYGDTSPSIYKPVDSHGLPIRADIEYIPKITTFSSDINFGQVDITSNLDKTVFGGPMSITNVSNLVSFTANYSDKVDLTNITDNSKVPVDINLVEGSQNGPILGNTFDITTDTDLYLKATLPGSSIYNKTLGTYTGSVTINLSTN